MAAGSMAKATIHEPVGAKDLWGHKGWQLPAYIQHVANDLRASGHDESRAIQIAVGVIKNWAAGHDGKGHRVTATTQAAAAKALAEWEALKARAAASHALTADAVRTVDLALSATQRTAVDRETATIRERAKTATFPHKFVAAQWTHPNGHPRCKNCGQEERTGGMCVKPTEPTTAGPSTSIPLTATSPSTVDLAESGQRYRHGWIPLTGIDLTMHKRTESVLAKHSLAGSADALNASAQGDHGMAAKKLTALADAHGLAGNHDVRRLAALHSRLGVTQERKRADAEDLKSLVYNPHTGQAGLGSTVRRVRSLTAAPVTTLDLAMPMMATTDGPNLTIPAGSHQYRHGWVRIDAATPTAVERATRAVATDGHALLHGAGMVPAAQKVVERAKAAGHSVSVSRMDVRGTPHVHVAKRTMDMTAGQAATVDLAWSEALHPRGAKGSSTGGKFVAKNAAAGSPSKSTASSGAALPADVAANVRDFQRRNGLPATGVIDQATAGKIRATQTAKAGGKGRSKAKTKARKAAAATKRAARAAAKARKQQIAQHVATVNAMTPDQRTSARTAVPIPPTGYVWTPTNTLRRYP